MTKIQIIQGSASGGDLNPAGVHFTGAQGETLLRSLQGETNLDWLSEPEPLFREQAQDANPFKIDTSTPDGVLALRVAMAVHQAGGYSGCNRHLKTALHLIEEGAIWQMPTPFARRLFTEALGAGSFDSVLLDAQYKRLMKGFKQRAVNWFKLPSHTKNVTSYKSQHAIQIGSFENMPKVPAGAPFLDIQFSDDRATYVVSKYGAVYAVTEESIVDDDLGVLGKTAERFGQGFANTIDYFVFYTLIDSNPTIYDGKVLFHSDHLNATASVPLSHDNLETVVKKLTTQKDLDGQNMNIRPWALIVHPNQEFEAERILNSDLRPGTAQNDKNVFKGMFPGGIIVTPKITSGTYYVIANPSEYETLEMGFLNGRKVPEMFIENPESGHRFEFDVRRWKGRLILGGCNVCYRWISKGAA